MFKTEDVSPVNADQQRAVGSPWGAVVKNLPVCQGRRYRRWGSILGSGRSPGGRNGNPLQYSCLGNPIAREAWRATIHRITKSQTWLSTHTYRCTKGCASRGLSRKIPTSKGDYSHGYWSVYLSLCSQGWWGSLSPWLAAETALCTELAVAQAHTPGVRPGKATYLLSSSPADATILRIKDTKDYKEQVLSIDTI